MARPDIGDFPQLSADVLYLGSGAVGWDYVIQASRDSFPASDAPGWISGRIDSARSPADDKTPVPKARHRH